MSPPTAASAEEALSTLLHDAPYGVAHVRGIGDNSRGGRYHNRRYAATLDAGARPSGHRPPAQAPPPPPTGGR